MISELDRLPNWQKALVAVASTHVTQDGEWGQTDCLMSVGDAIEAVVGVNPFEQFRGKYSTELGAAKTMRQHDCEDVLEVFAKFVQLTEVNRFQVRRGDVAVVIIQGQPHAGYVLNEGVVIRQPTGMITFPLDDIAKAFQIGRR